MNVERLRARVTCAISTAAGVLCLGACATAAGAEPIFAPACAAGPAEIAEYPAPIQWNEGRLQFACARLEDVVAEYNRHSAVRVVVRGDALADVLIGGAFSTEDAEAFTKGLETVLGLRAQRHGNTVTLIAETQGQSTSSPAPLPSATSAGLYSRHTCPTSSAPSTALPARLSRKAGVGLRSPSKGRV